MKAIAGVLGLFICVPIWFYLLHEVLQSVEATELMWFLYWAYLPSQLLGSLLMRLPED